MEETGGRNSVRTQRAVLEGVARALVHSGPGVSVTAIAQEAGVSKGGLLHHFASKDALILALTQDFLEQFRRHVTRCLDLSENHPGKLLRAYVRAVTEGLTDTGGTRTPPNLWGVLAAMPASAALLDDDTRRWNTDLQADGLHPDRVAVVYRAVNGLATDATYETALGAAEITALRDLLISLTTVNAPFDTSPGARP